MPGFLDSELGKLPPVPESSDPIHVAQFVDRRQVVHNRILIKHMDARFDELRGELMGAFPCSDPRASRVLLEAIMAKEKHKAQFWRHMEERLATSGAWAVLVAFGAVIWYAFTNWIKSNG